MIRLKEFLKKEYGEVMYKIPVDAGCTCPNRDGSTGYGGCIFCSEAASGEWVQDRNKSIREQIIAGKKLLKNKYGSCEKYIVYFQNFTNTYGDADILRSKYLEAAQFEDTGIISIATRPDCISDEILKVITEINKITPVWIELGLQTMHEATARYIRRGYELPVFEDAIRRLVNAGISHIITHLIFGLPGESTDMMLSTVRYLDGLFGKYNNTMTSFGVKLQLLHVISGTDLFREYEKGVFKCIEEEEYVQTVVKAVRIFSENVVIHRMTGDGNRDTLIAPRWSLNKRRVLNMINKELSAND